MGFPKSVDELNLEVPHILGSIVFSERTTSSAGFSGSLNTVYRSKG